MQASAETPLTIDEWQIVETSFSNSAATVRESIFSLANERMGSRGTFEEGYSGDSSEGNYFAGLCDSFALENAWLIPGFPHRREFIMNAMRWIGLRLALDGEYFDMGTSTYHDYSRVLDLKRGVLARSLVWTDPEGRRLKLGFERFLSTADRHIAALRVTVQAENFSGKLRVETDLDSSLRNYHVGGKCHWQPVDSKSVDGIGCLQVKTANSELHAAGAMALLTEGEVLPPAETREQPLRVAHVHELRLRQTGTVQIDKLVATVTSIDRLEPPAEPVRQAQERLADACALGYDELRREHVEKWDTIWEQSDVVIDGDPRLQQGIRYCVFQMHQAYAGVNPHVNIGAKALTGEWHLGYAYWDSDIYLLPFYLMTNPPAARSLAMFRCNTLEQARHTAGQMGYRGAKFPWNTISGAESSNNWRYGMCEIHINAAVAYGIWHYCRVTADNDLLFSSGLEVLVELCRFWVDRVTWYEHRQKYGVNCVVGPDEYRSLVDNNAYTNSMVSLTMQITLEALEMTRAEAAADYERFVQRLALEPEEPAKWRHVRDNMFIPESEELGVILQDETFLNTERVLRDDIRPEDRPVEDHWYLERLHRSSLAKQADVLLLLFLRPELADMEAFHRHYEYYEPVAMHDSSLSPCVHSIAASRAGLPQDAWNYFLMTARLDLDNLLGNTGVGLHAANLAGAWMCVTYGFAGMQTIGEVLSFAPSLPAEWNAYSFRFVYRGSLLELHVDREVVRVTRHSGPARTLRLYAAEHSTEHAIAVPLEPPA